MYPEYILRMLRQRRGLEANDTSDDDYLNRMPPNQAFAMVCNWEGLVGYAPVIQGWVKDIYGIDLT